MSDALDATRRSWNVATKNHNAHKGDQAAAFREGFDPLFPEELALLGPLEGRRVVHLQCNAGQDTLGLARRGAAVLGVDLSDEAIRFARELSAATGIPARFEESELLTWLAQTDERFDLAFSSYGAVGWIGDLDAWARGIARVLVPGGRFVYVEFHPLVWSVDENGALRGDDYFEDKPFVAPVGDYVAESGAGLAGEDGASEGANDVPATSYQHTLGQVVTALAHAGLRIERLEEWPWSNGCRVRPGLELRDGRRWHPPETWAKTPWMFGVVASR
ncbi:MAG: class I SAM-dependent methyltransferase [Polyangiales bacterium]